jgi:hypothetical protein
MLGVLLIQPAEIRHLHVMASSLCNIPAMEDYLIGFVFLSESINSLRKRTLPPWGFLSVFPSGLAPSCANSLKSRKDLSDAGRK